MVACTWLFNLFLKDIRNRFWILLTIALTRKLAVLLIIDVNCMNKVVLKLLFIGWATHYYRKE